MSLPESSTSSRPTILETRCHRLESSVTERVEDYFLSNWPFEDSRAKLKFRAAGYGHSTCCFFPEASDESIEPISLFLTALSMLQGRSYRKTLLGKNGG